MDEVSVLADQPTPSSDSVAGEDKPALDRYALVLYGASGFVGRQAALYLAKHPDMQGLRWAIAGRNAARLAIVKNACAAGAGQVPDILVADGQDQAANDALAAQAHVIASAAGPFARYGSALVAACVKQGTHYVDITGETPWVRAMITQHHQAALSSGTRIIPCCGFDSVPSDLSALLAQNAMVLRHGLPCRDLKTAFYVRGGFNGGTLESMFHLLDAGQAPALADPFLLNPEGMRPWRSPRHEDQAGAFFDVDFGAWLAPFFMAQVNTRVVRRSAALLGWDEDFAYQEYLRVGRGMGAAVWAACLSWAEKGTQTALQWAPVRAMARRFAPPVGTGPSEVSMDNGAFTCEWVASSADGHQLRGRIADHGDPGNRGTTKMLCESALALVCQLSQLPGGPQHGGVLTPASGLGQVLIGRLRSAGMVLEVLP